MGEDTLELLPSKGCFLMSGEIACLGGIVVRVYKKLLIVGGPVHDPLIQTQWYSYNVSIRNEYNILRYDNQDMDFSFREGHLDEHHKHVFDWSSGDELSHSPVWVGADEWPTLGQVLGEVQEWYWQNKSQIPCPDEYPRLDLR